MTKCCDVLLGDLNKKITLTVLTRTPDGSGGYTEGWTADPAGGVWARVRGKTGGEAWDSMRVSPQNRFTAVIHYRDDGSGSPYYQSGKTRAEFGGRFYNIISAIDIEQESRYIELELIEGQPS